jgi:hypothetical protein
VSGWDWWDYLAYGYVIFVVLLFLVAAGAEIYSMVTG